MSEQVFYRGKDRLVHTGPRGGRYVLVNNRQISLAKIASSRKASSAEAPPRKKKQSPASSSPRKKKGTRKKSAKAAPAKKRTSGSGSGAGGAGASAGAAESAIYLEAPSITGGKFWYGSRQGPVVLVKFGRLGHAGTVHRKDFETPELAEQSLQKVAKTKQKSGGYSRVPAPMH